MDHQDWKPVVFSKHRGGGGSKASKKGFLKIIDFGPRISRLFIDC